MHDSGNPAANPPQPPAHTFIKPGQLNSFDPVPDFCMRCGEPAAVHPKSTYAEEASIQDQLLDQKLMQISVRLDDGEITPMEAGNLRVAAIGHHLLAVTDLNHEWFGDPE